MTEKEKHEYLGFDRYLQVVGTKYEKELLKIEQKYYKGEIKEEEFDKLWNQIVQKMLKKA